MGAVAFVAILDWLGEMAGPTLALRRAYQATPLPEVTFLADGKF